MIEDVRPLAQNIFDFHLEKSKKLLIRSQLELLDLLAAEYGMREDSKSRFRKLILDNVNGHFRDIVAELELYEINFKT